MEQDGEALQQQLEMVSLVCCLIGFTTEIHLSLPLLLALMKEVLVALERLSKTHPRSGSSPRPVSLIPDVSCFFLFEFQLKRERERLGRVH